MFESRRVRVFLSLASFSLFDVETMYLILMQFSVISCRMRKYILNLLVLFSLALIAPSSWAEEVQYESDEYSTIKTDGQLIPVGERHRYKNTYKTWNVWTNPFGFFIGSFNLGASYAFHPNFKVNIEPQVIYYFLAKPKVVGGGATLSTSIFFKRVHDGFYLEPGARILYVSQNKDIGSADVDGLIGGPQLIAGWGWVWDAGFNINVGLGMGYFWGDVGKDIEDTESFEGIVPAGNLQFGFTF